MRRGPSVYIGSILGGYNCIMLVISYSNFRQPKILLVDRHVEGALVSKVIQLLLRKKCNTCNAFQILGTSNQNCYFSVFVLFWYAVDRTDMAFVLENEYSFQRSSLLRCRICQLLIKSALCSTSSFRLRFCCCCCMSHILFN